jgi:hypothetical protein
MLSGKTNGSNTVDVESLPDGLYYLELTTENGCSIHKFTKQQ